MSNPTTPPTPSTRTSTPPPLPNKTQRPKDLHPTILTALIHPNANEIVAQVNDYFLQHWPFLTQNHRKRFVDEGLAYSVCLTCPLSSDERMHWGCRLLTIGFLIDDLLDRMSLEEGIAHNMKVIECARGALPDRSVPAQYIMYDIFEGMRKVDMRLVDAVLQPAIDLLSAQVDSTRMKPMDLKEYFVYRIADLGKGLMSGLMRFCAGLHMTPQELELVKIAEENSMKHITFVNDICSWEKELVAAKNGFELSAVLSSVPIVMDLCGVNEHETKRVMWQMVRAWEVRHFELVDEILRESSSPAMKTYLQGLEHQIAGNEVWSLLTPRYNRTGNLGFGEGR